MALNRTVMFACVTFETAMVVNPAVEYNADEIHLFHYVRPGAPAYYGEFYKEVARQLRERLPRAEVVEHRTEPVYRFQSMLKEILTTMRAVRKAHPGCEFLINASAGTSEFSAAAIVACSMTEDATAFTVGTRTFTVPEDRIADLYYEGGRPVGLTRDTYPPRPIPRFAVEPPNEVSVRSLRAYAEYKASGRQPTASAVIQLLKDRGLWYYAPVRGEATSEKQRETMNYSRNFKQVWLDNGWIVRSGRRGNYELTDEGRAVIDTFYVDQRKLKFKAARLPSLECRGPAAGSASIAIIKAWSE